MHFFVKFKGVFYYAIILSFLGWCVIVFRADIAHINFAPVWAAWDVVFLAAALSLVNYFLRVVRWSFYLSRLGHSLPFSFSGITYIAGFAFTLSPGKVGEIVRGRYLQKYGIPLSSTAAAFFVERLMDLLAMVALACLAVASSSYDVLIWGTVSVIALIMVVLTLAPWSQISEWAKEAAWLPESLNRFVQTILRTLLSARVLLHPLMLATGFAIGIIAWGFEGVGLMVIGKISGGVSMDFTAAVSIYSVAVIVGALSFLPGGLGSTEVVMIAMLIPHGYSMPDAILITLVCRLLTLWLAVVIGWIAVFALRPKKMNEVCCFR